MKILGIGEPVLVVIYAVVAIAIPIVLVVVGARRERGSGAPQQAAIKYCPQCRAELPGTASFCKQCGRALPPAASTRQGASASGQSARSSSTAAIVGRVCAAVAIGAMFLPWVDVPGLQSLNTYSSSYLGVGVADDFSYTVFELVSNFTSPRSLLSSIPSAQNIAVIYLALLAGWAIALGFLAIGLIGSFFGGGRNFLALRVAGVIAALVAIAWFAAVTYLDSECSRQVAQMLGANFRFFTVPPAVWVTFIAALATTVCGHIAKASNK